MRDKARNDIVLEKLQRIQSRGEPRVLDLFAGCGGLSLGCELAGANIVGGVELDPAGALTYARNFHSREATARQGFHAVARDILKTHPPSIVRRIAPGIDPTRVVDVIVGGPPCQAFARVGRAKLREVNKHPEAFLRDPRATLHRQVLRYVRALAPVAIVIENVPDVLNFGGINLFEVIALALEREGYLSCYGLLNAAHYGVPQLRDRCFLIAIHERAGCAPDLPAPTHRYDLPRGYQGTRDVALKGIDLFSSTHYRHIPASRDVDEPAVTASEAIGDLPRIVYHLEGLARKVPQRLDTPLPVTKRPNPNPFLNLMTKWPNRESSGVVFDHVIRYLPRDYPIFAAMKAGDQYPEAHAAAVAIREQTIADTESRLSRRLTRPEIEAISKRTVPPYDSLKFPNKWRKMAAAEPARTLMAHLGKDSYSHIHYDSSQARTISVREAARLQSFPDSFRFAGTMNPAFRQIGNAVPPLLGYAVFSALLKSLGRQQRDLFFHDSALAEVSG